MHRRVKPVALAAALLFATTAFADDDRTIVVSATRFAESDPHVPADISVITKGNLPWVMKGGRVVVERK